MYSAWVTPRTMPSEGARLRVERGQFLPVAAGAVDGAGGEDAALVHHLHGRAAVLMDDGEDDLALADDRVDVEDVAGDELLQQEVALPVAELIERAPELLGILDLANAERRSLGARLEQPGRGHVSHVVAQFVVVEDARRTSGTRKPDSRAAVRMASLSR